MEVLEAARSRLFLTFFKKILLEVQHQLSAVVFVYLTCPSLHSQWYIVIACNGTYIIFVYFVLSKFAIFSDNTSKLCLV